MKFTSRLLICCISLLLFVSVSEASQLACNAPPPNPPSTWHLAIAEAQAGSTVDFAATLPTGSTIQGCELWAKDGPSVGTGWAKCDLSSPGRCGEVAAGYNHDASAIRDSQTDGKTVQVQIVPNRALLQKRHKTAVRGRLKVWYL